MRFLADENFSRLSVDALAGAGHDVAWIRTLAPGMSDNDIFRWAVRDGRVILTFDKDFGEISRGAHLSASCGIILFRLDAMPPSKVATLLVDVISSRSDWANHFSVVEQGRIRMRPLSRPAP